MGEGLGGVVWEQYLRDSVAITDSQQYILKQSIEMTDNNTLQINSVYAFTHAHTLNVHRHVYVCKCTCSWVHGTTYVKCVHACAYLQHMTMHTHVHKVVESLCATLHST